jgi:hypothetical protein
MFVAHPRLLLLRELLDLALASISRLCGLLMDEAPGCAQGAQSNL